MPPSRDRDPTAAEMPGSDLAGFQANEGWINICPRMGRCGGLRPTKLHWPPRSCPIGLRSKDPSQIRAKTGYSLAWLWQRAPEGREGPTRKPSSHGKIQDHRSRLDLSPEKTRGVKAAALVPGRAGEAPRLLRVYGWHLASAAAPRADKVPPGSGSGQESVTQGLTSELP